MLSATIAVYLRAFEDVVVVLRPEDTALARDLKAEFPRLGIVESPDAASGMGHSLAAGIHALDGWSYVFVGLGDMPFVEEHTLRALRERIEVADVPAIVQPTFERTPGHPVGFHAAYFKELGRLRGDAGARAVLARHPDRLIRVETADQGVVRDLDHPE